MKRCFDFFISLAAVILLSPLLVAIAYRIRCDAPGPVFYRGRRAGLQGRVFRIYKFRTMVADAESLGGPTTADNDPRLTPLGGLLRRYKLDELPQLFNVLKGEMSLVGPRPEVVAKVARYSHEEKQVLDVRPGITDWASIWNADEGAVVAGYLDPDDAYEKLIRPTKLRLQLMYCEQQSLWVDAKILFYTLLKLWDKNWLPPELDGFETPARGNWAGAQAR